MKSILTVTAILILILATGCPGTGTGGSTGVRDIIIEGAGASFPYPIYSNWAYEYEQMTGVKLNYQSVGSGAGISAIQSKTVDFGASDAPLMADELDEYGLIQFPLIIGGVVLVVNIPGIQPGEIRLSRDVLVDIYLGKITTWNDPAIADLNPDIDLPETGISVVRRADGSGTTWIFTSYMSSISDEWIESVGVGKSVEWPCGIGGRGNEGVANYVGQVEGSIGYVEYAYALQNDLTYVLLENREGNYVSPTADSFAAAAANADWANAPGYYLVLVDQPGADTWPIVGASFILIYKEQEDKEVAQAMLDFFRWCFTNGKNTAIELDYVPIPENVVEMIESTWAG